MPSGNIRPLISVEYFLRIAAWLLAICSEEFFSALMGLPWFKAHINYYGLAITTAALVFIAIRRLGPFPVMRDLEELCFYDVLVQIYGLILSLSGAANASYVIAAIAVLLLKFLRLFWWGKNLHGELLCTWPVFGVLGFFAKNRLEDPISHRHRIFIYASMGAMLTAAYFIWLYFGRIPRVGFYFVGILPVVMLTQRAAMDIQRRDEERIASLLDLERTKLLAEFNADAAARNADLRGAVHDLNNTIMPMTYTAHEIANCNDLASAKAIGQAMETRLRALSSSIVDVVEMAVVGTKLKTPADAVIDLADLAFHFSRELKTMAVERGIILGFNVVPGVGAIKSNEWLLQRIIHNLLMNAIVHGKRKTRVKLSLYCNRHCCIIRICDTGPGIAGADSPDRVANFKNVVNTLARNKATGPDQANGLVRRHGLGLRSVLRMSNTLDLQIAMQSRLGMGTIYRFKVPLADSCLP